MGTDQPAWLTVREVADELRVDEETVRRWIRRRELPAMSLGSRKGGYRVRRVDLDQFTASRLGGEGKGEAAA